MTVPSRRTARWPAVPQARPVEHDNAGRFLLRTLLRGGRALALLPRWLGMSNGYEQSFQSAIDRAYQA